jgi:hypothetical protein
MARGGSRTLGRRLATNTSGIAGIHFGQAYGSPVVYVCYGDKRTSFSVNANGVRGAIEKAVKRRREAGLPTMSVARAIAAYQSFRRRAARKAKTTRKSS